MFIPLRSRSQWVGCLTLFRTQQKWEILWAGRNDFDLRNRMPRQSFTRWCEVQEGSLDWEHRDLKIAQALGINLYMTVTQQRLNNLIHHQASYDVITQLPNWIVFNHRLSLSLVDTVHHGNMLGVIIQRKASVRQAKHAVGMRGISSQQCSPAGGTLGGCAEIIGETNSDSRQSI